MSPATRRNWQKDFGLDRKGYPGFFAGADDLNATIIQSHVLRHAFDLLQLDGILCSGKTPLIYFKCVDAISPDEVIRLHRRFWNHGGAPVLVLVSSNQVHVYSGMSRPASVEGSGGTSEALVTTLDRVATDLSKFLVSVESGEFFRRHSSAFNPDHRVDHDLLDNLKAARELLDENTQRTIEPGVLDALLCRLVFACYLFDRKVINEKYLNDLGLHNARNLQDILKIRPIRDAKAALYKLFRELGEDFNGDLFSDNLEVEARKITHRHVEILDDFFHGTNLSTGQLPFWPYDFQYIPIETISAIYEHFLKDEDQRKGAFYTPRFLAEVVLDSALENIDHLIGKKFLDPACGSGIFLVGLFNRLAEEWKQANPNARNDRRARELMRLLQDSLFGVDINPTACRITAFSLYLAYLDQLAPRDIQELQRKGRALPHLIIQADEGPGLSGSNLLCRDFFKDLTSLHNFDNADLVIGNPPWGRIATKGTPADQWCKEHEKPLPDTQIANAFIWKAAEHVSSEGKVCFILPHGVLLNRKKPARHFQRTWLSQHTLLRVLNLADLRKFLFSEARHPAVVISYQDKVPSLSQHHIEYWSPKADWLSTRAEVIPISPIDMDHIALGELVKNLKEPDSPQIWTLKYWGTERDIRFIDRLSLYPQLSNHIRQSQEKDNGKPWFVAEGFQPFGENDQESSRKELELPSKTFLPATSSSINLFLLEAECEVLPSRKIEVRRRIRNTDIFRGPHVLVTKGFTRIAYADFDVAFQHSVRGIHGPKEDRNLLIFLAAYLRSRLARYVAFHTSHNRSMFHEEVHLNELLRLPFPLPDDTDNPARSSEIIRKVAAVVDDAIMRSEGSFLQRSLTVETASAKIDPLIEEYFAVQSLEKILIEDTLDVLMDSIQPSYKKMPVPTVVHASQSHQKSYTKCLCSMLNGWAKRSEFRVRGIADRSDDLGIGIVTLAKVHKSQLDRPLDTLDESTLHTLHRLKQAIPQKQRTIDPVRGLMVFDKERLYIVKPIAQRHWTQTAALNDADEVAGTILMRSSSEGA